MAAVPFGSCCRRSAGRCSQGPRSALAPAVLRARRRATLARTSDWPLIGREGELGRIRALFDTPSRAVVLAGAPGVGKTRLGAEALAIASQAGFATCRVSATQAAASLPFGAFAALVPDLEPGLDRMQMLREVSAAITGRGNGDRVALLVDDAHLLDESSAALTHHLATAGDVVVIVTMRSGEPVSDAITALWKDGLAERIDVEPLGLEHVGELLAGVLGGRVDAATLRTFWTRTEGNALFLRELVVAAIEKGALRAERGLWRLSGPLPASERLLELVEARLKGLDELGRQCVLVLALAEPLGMTLVERLSGHGAVEALERRGLIRLEEDGRRLNLRLAHPLYAEVLRARLAPLRTRTLNRALADALEGCGARRREDALRLATWRLAGGGPLDRSIMLAGARQAYGRYDMALAERLARAAWESGPGLEAGLFLGTVISFSGRPEEAEAMLASLVPLVEDDPQRVALAKARIQNLILLRRLDVAISVAEEAEGSIVDMAGRAEIAAHHAALLSIIGDRAKAMALAESMLEHASGRSFVLLSTMLSMSYGDAGRLSACLRLSERGIDIDLTTDPEYRWLSGVHGFLRVNALTLAGDLAEAEKFANDFYAGAVDASNRVEQALAAAALAKTFTGQGRMATAVHWAQVSERLVREEGLRGQHQYALVYLALALALIGAHEEAADALRTFDALPGVEDPTLGPEVARARAWTAVATGSIATARQHLVDGAKLAREAGRWAIESTLLHDIARLGDPAAVAGRLAELATIVEGPLGPARALHARGLSEHDPTALESAMNAFYDCGALVHAAEAAVDAGVAWRRAGDPRRAARAERRAGAFAAQCEGAKTPALTTAAGARASLTTRELEIALLAAQGASNREIAARLYLSVHTVENRLHTAYEKLGVRRRSELESALGGAGLTP